MPGPAATRVARLFGLADDLDQAYQRLAVTTAGLADWRGPAAERARARMRAATLRVSGLAGLVRRAADAVRAGVPGIAEAARLATAPPQTRAEAADAAALAASVDARIAAGLATAGTPPAPTIPAADATPAEVAHWWIALPPHLRRQLLDRQTAALGRLAGLPAEVRDEANRRQLTGLLARLRAEHDRLAGTLPTIPLQLARAALVRSMLDDRGERRADPGRAGRSPAAGPAADARPRRRRPGRDRARRRRPGPERRRRRARHGRGCRPRRPRHGRPRRRPARRGGSAVGGVDGGGGLGRVRRAGLAAGPVPDPGPRRRADAHRRPGHAGRRPDRRAGPRHAASATATAARWSARPCRRARGPPTTWCCSAAPACSPTGSDSSVSAVTTRTSARLPSTRSPTRALFGADPGDRGFGATRIRVDAAPGRPWPDRVLAAHSHYFDPGSESLRNIARVVVGRGSDVTRPGATA